MRRMLGIAALCAVLGCGDDGGGSSPQDRLQGVWISESDEFECLYSVGFDGDYVELKEVCVLEGGGIAVVLHSGSFTATEDRVSISVEASTCANPRVARSASYSFQGESLSLVLPDGVIWFERAPPPSGGSGSATFGCFDDEGFFEPRSIGPV